MGTIGTIFKLFLFSNVVIDPFTEKVRSVLVYCALNNASV